MKARKIIRNLLLGLLALVLVLLVTFQIVMRPSVLTGIVNRVAADYVEGDVNFDQVKAHVIKSFPYLHLEASDFSITYPHQRYARYDSLYPDPGRRFRLMKAGQGPADSARVDTLASFRELDLWLNYRALMSGEVHVHKVQLTHPRIFAHYYDSTAANWDILPIGKDTSQKEKKPLPTIKIDHIRLTDRPFIVFTDPVDTLHGLFTLRRLQLDGKINTDELFKARASLGIDSLFASGRLPADTLAVRLSRLRADVADRRVQLEADASTRLRTNRFGRLSVPIHLAVDADIPEAAQGEFGALVHELDLKLSTLEMKGFGSLWKRADGTLDLDVQAAVEDSPLGELIREYRPNIKALQKIDTDARLSMTASAKGTYGNGQIPLLQAHVQIPKATLDYEGLGRKGQLALDGTLSTDENKVVDADVKQLLVDILGAKIHLKGSVEDVLGKDPYFSLSGTVRARVDSLTKAFSAERGITGTGLLDGQLQGRVRLSQMNMKKIGKASIHCSLTARNLSLQDPSDQLTAFLPVMNAQLTTKGNLIDHSIPQGARILQLEADIDTLNLQYQDMYIRGRDLDLKAQNSAEILKGGKELTPLLGLLKVGGLLLKDGDGVSLGIRDNMESFRISPATKERPTPRLSLRSNSGSVRIRHQDTRYGVRNLKFDLSASRHLSQAQGSARRNHLLDSLQRVYPGVERDSLLAVARRRRLIVQDEFASADIRLSLGNSVKQYVRNWDFTGHLDIGSARVTTPAFPLETNVSDAKGSFSNDELNLDNITVKAGESDLSAEAHLTGIRRLMLGRSRTHLKLKADVRSDYLEANELLRAYAHYSNYVPADASDNTADTTRSRLLVIPSNLEVDFSMEASGIKYDSLRVSWAAADVAMRDRTLQITNALAASNMGDIYFEGFYSTRSREDLKVGFDLNLVNITAEKVITLFPAVDTLMPMLTTFAGELDCELAATSDIDSTMNLVIPTIDGILKISGKDLQLKDSQEFTKIANKLMFRNRKEAHVDNMSVAGVVQDNVLEVFPFILNVDRYLFAASGRQSLYKDFQYHISVIKSPLLVKFGLNAWGPDFDHIHYDLTAPKYRNVNVPVYTKQLDTTQYNLIAAIHNIFELGVEKAMAENRAKELQLLAQSATADSLEMSQDSLERMEMLLGDVADSAEARREALKATILRLEQEAALQKRED